MSRKDIRERRGCITLECCFQWKPSCVFYFLYLLPLLSLLFAFSSLLWYSSDFLKCFKEGLIHLYCTHVVFTAGQCRKGLTASGGCCAGRCTSAASCPRSSSPDWGGHKAVQNVYKKKKKIQQWIQNSGVAVLGLHQASVWRGGTCLEHEHHEGVGWDGSKGAGGEKGEWGKVERSGRTLMKGAETRDEVSGVMGGAEERCAMALEYRPSKTVGGLHWSCKVHDVLCSGGSLQEDFHVKTRRSGPLSLCLLYFKNS